MSPETTSTILQCSRQRVLLQNAEGHDCQVVNYELYYDKVIKTQAELEAEFPGFYKLLSLPAKIKRGSN